MDLKEFLPIVAIITGPLSAVLITLWWQRRKERRDAKLRLFITLMANRKSLLPTYEWVNALNLLDVVFADRPKIVALWHELYALLQNPERTQVQDHKYLELLSEIARTLGFRRLQQTDIDKYYSPQIHLAQLSAQVEMQTELLRVLKKTSSLFVIERDDLMMYENIHTPFMV